MNNKVENLIQNSQPIQDQIFELTREYNKVTFDHFEKALNDLEDEEAEDFPTMKNINTDNLFQVIFQHHRKEVCQIQSKLIDLKNQLFQKINLGLQDLESEEKEQFILYYLKSEFDFSKKIYETIDKKLD